MCWRHCTLTCSGYEKECLSYQIPWQKKLFCIFRKFTFKLYVFLVVFCNFQYDTISCVRKFTFKLNSWSYFAALVSLVAQFLINFRCLSTVSIMISFLLFVVDYHIYLSVYLYFIQNKQNIDVEEGCVVQIRLKQIEKKVWNVQKDLVALL